MVVLTLIAVGSGMTFFSQATHSLTVVVPANGGSITEGIVGTPRFINPVLAQSDADKELTMLMFSGLMRALPDGSLVPDLAENYSVNEDGTVYTFTIRPDAVFHDGAHVTAYDVAYTIGRTQEPVIESPLEEVWSGIGVRTLDARTIAFTLSQPYASFLENVTIGILPQHLWESVSPEEFNSHVLNTEPVGSGPFVLQSVNRTSSGIPNAYVLRAFGDATRGRPYLDEIRVRTFGNQKELLDAYAEGDIDSFDSLDPGDAAVLRDDGVLIAAYELPRIFGIFFNQNKNETLTSASVREALSLAVNKERIIQDVLFGFGTAIDTPLPPHLFSPDTPGGTFEERREEAQELLANAGWEKDPETGLLTKKEATLAIVITTANTPELKNTAELVKNDWRTLGVDASVELFDTGQLHREIIRPREYEALLFGEVVGREGDVFPFWHSSQRNDPGLNVALYTNITADAILENIRTTLTPATRHELFASFVKEIETDRPAIFLYTPNLLYVMPDHVSGITVGVVHSPAERFLDVERWYTHTQRIWKLFSKES